MFNIIYHLNVVIIFMSLNVVTKEDNMQCNYYLNPFKVFIGTITQIFKKSESFSKFFSS